MNFHIGGDGSATIHDAICKLARERSSLSIAVSYIQMSGWELLKATLTEHQIKSLRILCTDQFGITDPNAVREIIKSGAAIRAFTGNVVFHPKVYIGTTKGTSDIFLMGSANLSRSALISGVEADLAGEDNAGKLKIWFDGLFDDNSRSANFDEDRLTALDLAFSSQTKSRIAFKRFNKSKIQPENHTGSTVGDASIMESIFSNLRLGTTPLNFDKAGNNIRRLGMILDVLHGKLDVTKKTVSEMKLLGLSEFGQLTHFGKVAANAASIDELAGIWMTWLKTASDTELLRASPSGQLMMARGIFERFWTLPKEVTDYFIEHSQNPNSKDKLMLQTIELLSNAGRKLPLLTLDDISILSTVLRDTSALSPEAAGAVKDYLDNKGTRGWKYPDRRLAVLAWRDAGT